MNSNSENTKEEWDEVSEQAPRNEVEFVDWLFVDLNSFFASVEQQLNPVLRNRPVAVVPVLAETTSCIAASYEAKAFGVKTGTRVSEARQMCPGIRFVKGNHKNYADYHHRIIDAVESCLPVTVVMSIDEMACRLTGSDRGIPKAMEIAKGVKQKIRELGSELGCSVGLAPNRYLAKVASDMQKPDGLTVVRRSEIPQKFFRLKPRDFPGIGHNMEIRLQKAGIYTVEQMYQADLHKMRSIWSGVVGERFYKWIRGENLEISTEKHKSISHSHVLAPELRNPKGSYAVAQKLLHKAAYRLRKINHWACGMSVSLKYLNGSKWREEVRMLECQDTFSFNKILQEMWKTCPGGSPIKVSVVLSDLVADENRNASFFEETKGLDLSRAMDRLNNKYNKNLVYLAGVDQAKVAAPTRIAFSNIPSFDLEGE
ncbi:MAG: DNA polymerase [Bdellovibrionales bacterium]